VGLVGQSLVGTPYVAYTLEIFEDREVCVVNLRGLDCVTFFETTLGIARMLGRGERTPEALTRQVTLTRYRGGQIAGYPSRLHYTCDWMEDNARKGTVRMLTPDLPGSEPFRDQVYYMSAHPESYRQLKAHSEWVPAIANAEQNINRRPRYYVPVDKIEGVESILQTGDIVGITKGQKGIDCAHTGLCVRDSEGVLRFLHAGQTAGRVQLEGRLSEYLSGWATGAMFVRPLEVERPLPVQ